MEAVEVEICVYKPDGYSITYLVVGTDDRMLAVNKALDMFKEQDKFGLKCLNYINSNVANDKPRHGKIVVINLF